MSSTNNPSSPGGSDPSMEDILASIRRILSEDEPPPDGNQASPAPPAEETPPHRVIGQPEPVLVLDPSMMIEEQKSSSPVEKPPVEKPPGGEGPSGEAPRGDDPGGETGGEGSGGEDHARRGCRPGASACRAGGRARAAIAGVIPCDAEIGVARSGNRRCRLLLGRAPGAYAERTLDSKLYQGGPTIEDLVREELRPILKQWLDANLPTLVERCVRQEIERVVGRAAP